MFWIAQAALGAALGELMLGRRLGNRALAWGAMFGLLPLLDVIAYPLLGTGRELWWHRGPSHSLPVLALVAWAAARGLDRLWKRDKIGVPKLWLAVFGLLAGHVALDCLTVDGAAVFWPLESRRISLGLLDSGDFLFVASLAVPVIWMAFLKDAVPKKSRSKKPAVPSERRRLLRWSLGLAIGYIMLAAGAKALATKAFQADLDRRGVRCERRIEMPTRHNILLWRAVADCGGEFHVGYRSIFESSETPVRWTIYPQRAETLAKVADLPETKILTKLTDGWWLARRDARGAWLGDLRRCEARTWGARKGMVDSRLARAWVIDAKSERHPLLAVTPHSSEDFLKRLMRRIFGNREEWEANPRLAGVPGSFPEPLDVNP